jgi:hypothetical protein
MAISDSEKGESINHATQGSGQQQRTRRDVCVCVFVCVCVLEREGGGLSLYLCAHACEETNQAGGREGEGQEKALGLVGPSTSERLHGNAGILIRTPANVGRKKSGCHGRSTDPGQRNTVKECSLTKRVPAKFCCSVVG